MALHVKPNAIIFVILIFWGCCLPVHSQKNADFSEEVKAIAARYQSLRNKGEKTVVFTGSSSIRLWKGLESSFPHHRIVNTGFGGSESADLLHYIEPLVLDFHPEKVFIYEGDNDLSYRRSPARVVRTTRNIIDRIQQEFPTAEVVLISAKPSPERWNLRKRFRRLNRKFERLAQRTPLVGFADIWEVMLREDRVNDSLFTDDGLHMNEKGYALWYEVIRTYLN
jgi:lysophospholipase L1-like esterase